MPNEIHTNNAELWTIRNYDGGIQWTVKAKLILLKLVKKYKHQDGNKKGYWKIVYDRLIAKGMPESKISNVENVYRKLKTAALHEKNLQLKQQHKTGKTKPLSKLYAETIKHIVEIQETNKYSLSKSDDDTDSEDSNKPNVSFLFYVHCLK